MSESSYISIPTLRLSYYILLCMQGSGYKSSDPETRWSLNEDRDRHGLSSIIYVSRICVTSFANYSYEVFILLPGPSPIFVSCMPHPATKSKSPHPLRAIRAVARPEISARKDARVLSRRATTVAGVSRQLTPRHCPTPTPPPFVFPPPPTS